MKSEIKYDLELLATRLNKHIDIALEEKDMKRATRLINILDDLDTLFREKFLKDVPQNIPKTLKLPAIAYIPLAWMKRFAFALQKEAHKQKNMQAGVDASKISGMIFDLESFIEDVIANNPDLDLGDYE